MDSALLGAGIACVIGAIIGGGLKGFGIELPLVSSIKRQFLLAVFGAALLAMSFWKGDTPLQPSSQPSAAVSGPGVTTPQAASEAPPASPSFEEMFASDKTDELKLARDGEKAYGLNDYSWTIRFLAQAKVVETAGVWQSSFPFLYGAQVKLGQQSEAAQTKRAMLNAATAAVNTGNGYLSSATTIGFLIRNLGVVRNSLPASNQPDVDDLITQMTQLKARAS